MAASIMPSGGGDIPAWVNQLIGTKKAPDIGEKYISVIAQMTANSKNALGQTCTQSSYWSYNSYNNLAYHAFDKDCSTALDNGIGWYACANSIANQTYIELANVAPKLYPDLFNIAYINSAAFNYSGVIQGLVGNTWTDISDNINFAQTGSMASIKQTGPFPIKPDYKNSGITRYRLQFIGTAIMHSANNYLLGISELDMYKKL